MGRIQNSLLGLVGAGSALAMGISKFMDGEKDAKAAGKDNQMAQRALKNVAQKQFAQQAINDRVQARREGRQVNMTPGEAGKLAAERALARRKQTSPVLSQRKEVE